MNASHPRVSQVDLFIDASEQRLIDTCIKERWLTEGPNARAFADKIKAETGAAHVYFAPNGTLGLFLALLALDLEPGSEIVMPSFTFYGTATSAIFAGLKPVYIDVDPDTFNATPTAFAAAITPRTRALMPVHIYGQVCDMPGIMAVAKANNLKVVEDAAQAFGATLNGKSAGTFGDIGVFSFFSDKIITTGEGGCLITNDDDLAARVALLRNQGRPNSGTFVHPALGMNFRITDLQAAIGLSQIAKLPTILADRKRKWQMYSEGLAGIDGVDYMKVLPGSSLVPFRFPILTADRAGLEKALNERGIQTRGFFYPMHLQPKLAQVPPQMLPVSEDLHARGTCLPIHYHLNDAHIEMVISAIRDNFGA